MPRTPDDSEGRGRDSRPTDQPSTSASPDQQSASSAQPSASTAQPSASTDQPSASPAQPSASPAQPSASPAQPSTSSGPVAETAPPPPQPPAADDEPCPCVSVVLCPSEAGAWSRLTCALGFVAAFACDGVCASLFLFDSRYGAGPLLPPRAHAVEHLAVVWLLRHLTEPFSCAFINWYGFRRCLFAGSVLSITWITLLCFIENAFSLQYYRFGLAVVGGIGIGMIKTSFFVLLSTLFVLNRHTAHLTGHLGTFAGMLLVPPLSEFVMLTFDWHAALYLHFGLICTTIVFWLLVATPWPFKIQLIEEDPLVKTSSAHAMPPSATARDVKYLPRTNRFPTIEDSIGNYEELRLEPLTDTTPVFDNRKRLFNKNGRGMRHVTWLYEKREDRRTCVQNVTNMFEDRRMVGSRPMYRDDIFFDGNTAALKSHLKFNEHVDYLMATTRVFTVADLNEENHERCCVMWPTAVSRVLKSMFDPSIFCEIKFVVYATSEALIHASYLIPFIFVKGPLGKKTSSEAMIVLIACCCGLFYGRGIGYWLHETSSNMQVSPCQVSMVLIANGLAILLCSTDDFAKVIACYGIFGCLFGYYKSIQSSTLIAVFPLKKFNNVHGYISVVRAVSSLLGILIALRILRTTDGSPSMNDDYAFLFAGTLMMASSLCMCLLQRSSSAAPRHGQRMLDRGRGRPFQPRTGHSSV